MKEYILKFRAKDRDNFEEVREGLKKYETRAASVRYLPIKEGDVLVFVCGKEKLSKKVKRKHHFKSIVEMVSEIPFKSIMPSIESVEAMKKVYDSYPDYPEKIKKNGILAFELE